MQWANRAGQRRRGRGTTTQVPQTSTETATRPRKEGSERSRPQTRAQGTTSLPVTLPPNPLPVFPPLLMCKEDDRAPQKLFHTLRPLTGRVLSPTEWTRWCHGLERWTVGLSEWAYRRDEVNTPQKGWKRRQRNKRGGGRQGQGRETSQGTESEERPRGPTQAGQIQRNRTITRMANLQRRYNDSP